MSRSYKKTPIIRYETEDYTILNRQFRRQKNTAEIASHGGYRRFSRHCSSWKTRWTKCSAIHAYYDQSFMGEQLRTSFPTLDDFLAYWKKCVYYK